MFDLVFSSSLSVLSPLVEHLNECVGLARQGFFRPASNSLRTVCEDFVALVFTTSGISRSCPYVSPCSNLWSDLEQLKADGLLSDSALDTLHKVRILGNDGSHGKDITSSDFTSVFSGFKSLLFRWTNDLYKENVLKERLIQESKVAAVEPLVVRSSKKDSSISTVGEISEEFSIGEKVNKSVLSSIIAKYELDYEREDEKTFRKAAKKNSKKTLLKSDEKSIKKVDKKAKKEVPLSKQTVADLKETAKRIGLKEEDYKGLKKSDLYKLVRTATDVQRKAVKKDEIQECVVEQKSSLDRPKSVNSLKYIEEDYKGLKELDDEIIDILEFSENLDKSAKVAGGLSDEDIPVDEELSGNGFFDPVYDICQDAIDITEDVAHTETEIIVVEDAINKGIELLDKFTLTDAQKKLFSKRYHEATTLERAREIYEEVRTQSKRNKITSKPTAKEKKVEVTEEATEKADRNIVFLNRVQRMCDKAGIENPKFVANMKDYVASLINATVVEDKEKADRRLTDMIGNATMADVYGKMLTLMCEAEEAGNKKLVAVYEKMEEKYDAMVYGDGTAEDVKKANGVFKTIMKVFKAIVIVLGYKAFKVINLVLDILFRTITIISTAGVVIADAVSKAVKEFKELISVKLAEVN